MKNSELFGLSDEELIARLQWDNIPDGRRIQEERIASICSPILSSEDSYEGIMRRIEERSEGKDKRFSDSRRLIQLPDNQLREVYSLAIPLAIPSLDFSVKTGRHCSRWQKTTHQMGATHLTTSQGLEKLLAIFQDGQIPVTDERVCGPLCDELDRGSPTGKTVPHSWYVNTYDPYESLFTHQFVVVEYRIFLVPYSAIERRTVESEGRRSVIGDSYITVTNETTTYKTFEARTAVFCEDHLVGARDWIAKKHSQVEEGKSRRSIEVVNIKEPVLIYDPAWIN